MARNDNGLSFRRWPRYRPQRPPARRRTASDALWLARHLLVRFVLVALPVVAGDLSADYFAGVFTKAEQTGTCRIERIVDGDTVGLSCASAGSERGRLMGFDAPELFSPKCVSEVIAAERAKWALRNKIWSAKDLRVEPHGRDRYDRLLIRVYVDGRDISGAMISGGYARRYDGGPRGGWC